MTTPTLLFVISLAFPLASFAQAGPHNADHKRSALDQKHAEINAVVAEVQRKIKDLRKRGLLCSMAPKQVNEFFLTPIEKKYSKYKSKIDSSLTDLKMAVEAKKGEFANVDACEIYKKKSVEEFTREKNVIAKAQETIREGVIAEVKADLKTIYTDRNVDERLGKRTPYEVLSGTFEKTKMVPSCPVDALKVFHGLLHITNKSADMNKFAEKLLDLDKLLDQYEHSLTAMIQEISSTKCGSVVAGGPVQEQRPHSPEPKVEREKVSTVPAQKGNATPEIPQRGGPAAPAKLEPQAQTTEPAPITETDRWGKPKSWKEYDEYKASIGAPNKVAGVDLNTAYNSFLSTNGIQLRNADDVLRLQKAINETTIQVAGPDGIGPSVYQDGQVGSRTKSALYLMQNDPYYRDTLLANLRRQGLMR